MKKILVFLCVILMCFNIYLALQIKGMRDEKDITYDNNGVVVNNNVVNGYATDVTNVVHSVQSKVATVTSYVDYEYFYSTASCIKYEEDTAYFVTNYHGVKDSDLIQLSFDNGAILPAIMVGFDEVADLAVLSVKTDFKVNPFNFGDSSLLKKGEFIISIGTPISKNFEGSALVGNVSGLNRSFTNTVNEADFDNWETLMIQTNLALNEGDSGGPLINMAGELVGINTFKLAGEDVSLMSFALPINEAKIIIDELINEGICTRSVLGLAGRGVSAMSNYQKSYEGISLDLTYGVCVDRLAANGPLLNSGIQAKDILLTLNGTKLENMNSLLEQLYHYNTGDVVEITYLRKGEENKASVVLG